MSPDADLEPDAAPEDADVARTWRLHERTGEIELIISGALLIGLFQLPERLDLLFEHAQVRLSGSVFTGTLLVWTYVSLMVYTLIGSFSLHLVARAYWVGLVGLDSAFPGGVDWDRIRYGPLAKQVYRERLSSLPVMARRADDFASSIFSFAFWIVLIFVLSIVLVGILGAVALVLTRTVLPGVAAGTLVLGIAVGLALLPLIAIGLDRALEGRIDPEGRFAGTLKGMVALSYRIFVGPLFMPIQFTLFSNIPKKVIWPTYLGVFVVLFVVLYAGLFLGSGLFLLSPSDVLPTRPGPRSVDTRYYEDRGTSRLGDPTIPSDVIEGPYLRLTVPFVARRDFERVAELCPELEPLGRVGLVRSSPRDTPADPAALDAALGCFGRLWTVRLDGLPLAPDWDFLSSPGSGVTGMVAYLSTDGMAPGAHLLELEALVASDRKSGAEGEGGAEGEPERRRHFIRFRI